MMDSATESEIYHPLKEGQIRLMRINYCSTDDTCISCNLGTFSLAQIPPYVALSYCWTQEPPSHLIRLNERRYWARPNLFNYLQIMFEEQQECWIFIDALCINQDDIAERGQQVKLMGQVYSEAQEVVAWLGTPSDSLEDPEFRYGQELIEWSLRIASDDSEFLAYTLTKLSRDPETQGRFAAFLTHKFFRVEYWRRIWIVQEIILARKLKFRIHGIQMRSQQLEAITRYLQRQNEGNNAGMSILHHYFPPQISGDIERDTSTNSHMAGLLLGSRKRKIKEEPDLSSTTLADLFSTYVRQDCSEIRDKVFSLLGLVHTQLEPTYQMPILEVFLRAYVEAFIEDIRRGQKKSERADPVAVDLAQFSRSMLGAQLLYNLQLSPYHPTVASLMKSLYQNSDDRFRLDGLSTSQLVLLGRTYLSYSKWSENHVRRAEILIAHRLFSARTAWRLWICRWRKGVLQSPSNPTDVRTPEAWSQWASDLFTEIAETGEAILEKDLNRKINECENQLLEYNSRKARNEREIEYGIDMGHLITKIKKAKNSLALSSKIKDRGALYMLWTNALKKAQRKMHEMEDGKEYGLEIASAS